MASMSWAQFIHWNIFALYAFGVLWIVECDTIYGYQDYKEDLAIGVRSLPVSLGYGRGKYALMLIALLRYVVLGVTAPSGLALCALVGLAFYAQTRLLSLDLRHPALCHTAFVKAPFEGLCVTLWIWLFIKGIFL
jgi:4-hydroxybenzoate polyprenyltransferase